MILSIWLEDWYKPGIEFWLPWKASNCLTNIPYQFLRKNSL